MLLLLLLLLLVLSVKRIVLVLRLVVSVDHGLVDALERLELGGGRGAGRVSQRDEYVGRVHGARIVFGRRRVEAHQADVLEHCELALLNVRLALL